MKMTPDIAAMRLGRALVTAEDGTDRLLTDLSTLIAEMTNVRLATASPAATGHRAIARAAAAQAKLVGVRMDLIRAHEDLRRIAETADVPSECPPMAAELEQDMQAAA